MKNQITASASALVIAALLALTAMLASAGARAQELEKSMQSRLQTGATKLENACGDDIKKYCSQVTPGEGRMIYCMQAYEDKLSAKCLAAVYDAAQNVQLFSNLMHEVTNACRDDAVKTCGKVQVGHGRVLQCLIDNKSTVSKVCADSVQKISDFAASK